jgi:dipeptidyl-peptidase-3
MNARLLPILLALTFTLLGCKDANSQKTKSGNIDSKGFVWSTEHFDDVKIIRYQVPGFEKLSLQQKKLVYYLYMAGLSGRDIIYDQNYRHNLHIRRALEKIWMDYTGDKTTTSWKAFELYLKQIWVSSGIHHHYGNEKFIPGFSEAYLDTLLKVTNTKLNTEAKDVIFNPNIDNFRTSLDPSKDLVRNSAVNFYDSGISEQEVDAFFAKIIVPDDPRPISYGLNSKLVRNADGTLSEKVYKQDGMYGAAIKEIIKWLEKAAGVAENKAQGDALRLLIDYYKTGDLKKWDEYNVAWVKATEGDIDYINGFIEVYHDPKGYKASYESLVQIRDFDATERMKVLAENAQWFEDNSPLLPQHKKKEVKGVSYRVVHVLGEAGDVSPTTPIGVNLPNANWIRAEIGSKSVSLGNILDAYNNADGPGMVDEFAHDEAEKKRAKAHGALAAKLHTALHEVVGHASGVIEPGVGETAETLVNYASAIEEGRADLVALYYIYDQKLVDLKLIPSLETGKAQYDAYLRNGLLTQLRRINPGKNIEEAHMRNRAFVSRWVLEKGKAENVVQIITANGKTFVKINDYEKLRVLFGELLREVQRIKSKGDYNAAAALVENYGVKVDPALHQEVLARSERLKIPPYGAFINPRLVPSMNDKGEIIEVKLEYPADFTKQMFEYAKQFSFLPDYN